MQGGNCGGRSMARTGLRRALTRRMPWLVPLKGAVRMISVSVRYSARVVLYRICGSRGSVFRSIYLRRAWCGGSGGGSGVEQTRAIRAQLPELARELRVRSVLDAPCGDYRWMSQVEWDLESYVGVDIVPELIEINRAAYQTDAVRFAVADITCDPLPRADLVLVRDCFVHMSHRDIKQALRNLKATGSTFLLTTTYPGGVRRNWNIMTGWWRALDFERPPFNFPAPERVLDEHNVEEYDKQSKSLGLWRFEDLSFGEGPGKAPAAGPHERATVRRQLDSESASASSADG